MQGFVVFGLLLATATACAQPAPVAESGLFFTSKALGSAASGSEQYAWEGQPGSLGTAPLAPSYISGNRPIEFVASPGGSFTYLDPVLVKLPLRCGPAGIQVNSISLSLELGTNPTIYYGPLLDLPQTCVSGQVMDLHAKWDLSLMRINPGTQARLAVETPLVNAGTGAGLEVVTGDAGHPAGVFGNWSFAPLFIPWTASYSWTEGFQPSGGGFWATDAGWAYLSVNGTLQGANHWFEIQVQEVASGNVVSKQRFETTSDEPKSLKTDVILKAGNGTAWTIRFSGYADKGSDFGLRLAPFQLGGSEIIQAISSTAGTENPASNGTFAHSTAPPAKPMASVAVAFPVLLVILAARKARK